MSRVYYVLASVIVVLVLLTGIAIAQVIDTSTAQYFANLRVINTSTVQENLQVPFSFSGQSLVDQDFINSGGLNTVVVGSSGESVPAMPASLRISMESCKQDDGGVFTTYTTECNDATVGDIQLLPASPATADAFYFGFNSPGRILTLSISQGLGGNTITLEWQYWNGSSWTPFSGTADTSENFSLSGLHTVTFDLPNDWVESTVDGVLSFWVRSEVADVDSVPPQQALATQAWWETGAWWIFVDSVGQNTQNNYGLYLGGPNMITRHRILPGDGGIITPDNVALELGSEYTIRIDAFLPFSTTGDTSRLVFKEGTPSSGDPISVFISNIGEITARVSDGITTSDLVVSGITSGDHSIELAGSDTLTTLTIIGVGSDTTGDVSILDSTGDWQFGTNSSVSYFDDIEIFGGAETEVTLFDTNAEWDTGTHNQTDAVAGSLELEGTTALDCVPSTPPVGWSSLVGDCGPVSPDDLLIPTVANDQALFDSRSYKIVETTSAAGGDIADLLTVIHPAAPGEAWSTSIWVRAAGDSGGTDLTFTLFLEFMDGAVVVASHNDFESSLTANLVWTEIQIDNKTAPASTDGVRLLLRTRVINNGNPGTSGWWDGAMLVEAAVAPDFPNVNNVLANPGFEAVFQASGNWISPTITSTADNILNTEVEWTLALPAGTVATGESSIDDQVSWQVLTNGGSIPGINTNDNLIGTNIYFRLTLEPTSVGDATPSFSDLMLTIRDFSSGDRVLFYQLDTMPTRVLSDGSVSNIDGALNFPNLSTTSITLSQDPLKSLRVIENKQSQALSPDVADLVDPGNFQGGNFNPTGLPLNGVWVALSNLTGGDIPPVIYWIVFATWVVIFAGLITFVFTQSVPWASAVMIIFMIGFVSFGQGLFPLWVLLFFGLMAMASSIYYKVRAI